MKYYLDTNILYNLKRLPDNVIASGFTSIIALIELVSGISDVQSYNRRKSVIQQLFSRRLAIDYAMPEEIIFNSFDVFWESEFVEHREEKLMKLIGVLLSSSNYDQYRNSDIYVEEFGHAYFKKIDDDMSDNFRNVTDLGISMINAACMTDTLDYNGKTYAINNVVDMVAFLEGHPEVNRSFTINALVKLMNNISKEQIFSDEFVCGSYNGLVDRYVEVFSSYCLNKLKNRETPATNDFVDLVHILYLKNDGWRKMVSDDKLLKKYLGAYAIGLEDLR